MSRFRSIDLKTVLKARVPQQGNALFCGDGLLLLGIDIHAED